MLRPLALRLSAPAAAERRRWFMRRSRPRATPEGTEAAAAQGFTGIQDPLEFRFEATASLSFRHRPISGPLTRKRRHQPLPAQAAAQCPSAPRSCSTRSKRRFRIGRFSFVRAASAGRLPRIHCPRCFSNSLAISVQCCTTSRWFSASTMTLTTGSVPE